MVRSVLAIHASQGSWGKKNVVYSTLLLGSPIVKGRERRELQISRKISQEGSKRNKRGCMCKRTVRVKIRDLNFSRPK